MIIANRQGHTKASPGASDILNEIIENEPLLKEVNRLLIEKGHKIVNCYPGDNAGGSEWNIGVAKANSSNAYMFFSIHFNSTKGAYGCEILTSSLDKTILPYANKILKNLENLGFRNRGIKIRDDLAETVSVDLPAMIIEVCFIHERDAEIYKKVGMNIVSRAIANGIDNNISLNNIIEEVVKIENVVIYTKGSEVDRASALFLKECLNECSIFTTDDKVDYSKFKNIYGVGGSKNSYTSYLKNENFLTGSNRYETMKSVLRKLGKL